MWDTFFNNDNPIWNAMGRVFDLFILNTLLLICCIPIVTIGPALTAFYYVLIGLARGEEGYISKDFFRSFKMNLKQGMLIGVPMTLIGVFLMVDIWMCRNSGTGIYSFFMTFFAFLFIVWIAMVLYTFPVLAKFDMSTKDILIRAFTLCIKNWWRTIIMLLTIAMGIFFIRIISGLIFIMFGLMGDIQGALLAGALKPFLPIAGVYEDHFMMDEVSEETAECNSDEQQP